MGDFNTSPAIAEEKEEIKISNEKKKDNAENGKKYLQINMFHKGLVYRT